MGPGGRGEQTGDVNVPECAEVAPVLQEAEWLAVTVSGRHSEARRFPHTSHVKSKAVKAALDFD